MHLTSSSRHCEVAYRDLSASNGPRLYCHTCLSGATTSNSVVQLFEANRQLYIQDQKQEYAMVIEGIKAINTF